jgi:hypothetical protein
MDIEQRAPAEVSVTWWWWVGFMTRAAYALVGMEVEKIWGTIVPRFAGTRKREHDTTPKSDSLQGRFRLCSNSWLKALRYIYLNSIGAKASQIIIAIYQEAVNHHPRYDGFHASSIYLSFGITSEHCNKSRLIKQLDVCGRRWREHAAVKRDSPSRVIPCALCNSTSNHAKA